MTTRTATVELHHQLDGSENAPADRSAEFFRALTVVCWSGICGLRSLEIGLLDPYKYAVVQPQVELSRIGIGPFLRDQQTTVNAVVNEVDPPLRHSPLSITQEASGNPARWPRTQKRAGSDITTHR
jgi:hypothetical protein